MLTKHEILEKELAKESATILRVLRENFISGGVDQNVQKTLTSAARNHMLWGWS